MVLPAPVIWNYVYTNADFAKNKTIYITLMVICLLYIQLMIYARYKDKKDLQKVQESLFARVRVVRRCGYHRLLVDQRGHLRLGLPRVEHFPDKMDQLLDAMNRVG